MTTSHCLHIRAHCWIIACFAIDTRGKLSINKEFIEIYFTYLKIKIIHTGARHVRNILYHIRKKNTNTHIIDKSIISSLRSESKIVML